MIIWALFHVLLGIIEHLGPTVPLADVFVDEEPAFRVVFTVIIVDFLHYYLGFVWSETPQVRVRVQLEVRLFVQDVS